VLVLVSLILLSRWGVRNENPIASRLSFLVTPVQSKAVQLWDRVHDFGRSWQEVFEERHRVQQLEQEILRLRQQLSTMKSLQNENLSLRRLYGLAQEFPWEAVPAVVIGRGGEQFQTLLLNRGSADGIAVDQPVVAYGGVVGRVHAVQPHACLVLQITDPNSSVGVFAGKEADELSREAVAGILIGGGPDGIIMEPKGGVDVPQGCPVYTSSLSTIYPPGLLVGTIEGFLETGYSLQRRLVVKAAVDFDQLREVLILSGLNRREAVTLGSESTGGEQNVSGAGTAP